MAESDIRDRLLERGRLLFSAPPKFVDLSHERAADELLNDLEAHPHAYVIACLMDRQVLAERAWIIPYRLQQRLGGFEFHALERLNLAAFSHLMNEPEPLHRFRTRMPGVLYGAVRRIAGVWHGNAAEIWTGRPSSAAVVSRFRAFEGAGPKISTMATNILAREFKVPFSDYRAIDVSADVHVARVFARLGLVPEGASVDAVILRARELHPEFPGLMDSPAWQIGRQWCAPRSKDCHACFMADCCPSSIKSGAPSSPLSGAPPTLEASFHRAMIDVYTNAIRRCRYHATAFIAMVTETGGLATAKFLLAASEPQSGFYELWKCGCLGLTMEAQVLKSEYAPLFTEVELREAGRRLKGVGFSLLQESER